MRQWLVWSAIAMLACAEEEVGGTAIPLPPPVRDQDTGGDITPPGATNPTDDVCERWEADRIDLSEGTWTGSIATCDAGTLDEEGRANTLRMVNLYRWMAGQPPVTEDAARSALAQPCALMMHANNALSHAPPTTWDCYSDDGAAGAGASNIATTPAVQAIDLYMVDAGNADTLGHRRWILSNGLSAVGIGGTSEYSCLYVFGGGGTSTQDWVAMPSAGAYPMEAMNLADWATVDAEGWHIQSDVIDLNQAIVTVTRGEEELLVTTNVLPANFGSSSAISFQPNGWTSEPGIYHVSVGNIGASIEYDVELVDCAAL